VLAVANVCQFPVYLGRAASTTSTGSSSTGNRSTSGDSQWVTELRYSPITSQIQSRLDVVVFDSELMAKVSFAVHCQPHSSSASANHLCYQTELVYRRSCVERFNDDKFKVLHNEGLWALNQSNTMSSDNTLLFLCNFALLSCGFFLCQFLSNMIKNEHKASVWQ